mgnify:CR=1 FL=1
MKTAADVATAPNAAWRAPGVGARVERKFADSPGESGSTSWVEVELGAAFCRKNRRLVTGSAARGGRVPTFTAVRPEPSMSQPDVSAGDPYRAGSEAHTSASPGETTTASGARYSLPISNRTMSTTTMIPTMPLG